MIGCRPGSRLVIACVIACTAGTAYGQAPASSAAATAQFDRGRALVKAGKYAEACAAFEHSQKLEPLPGTLYNLAGCYANLGKLASAWVAFRELAQRDTNTARRTDSGRKAKALEPRLPRLLIRTSASPPGLVVTMNDQDVTALLGVDSPVDLGSYKIVARAPAYRDQHATVEVVAEGKTATVTLELERAPVVAPPPRVADELIRKQPVARPADREDDAPAPPPSRRRTYALITAGSGVVLVATGVVFGGMARSKWNDVKALCGDDLVCEAGQGDEGTRLSDAAHRNANIATGLAIGGAVAIGAGAVLWLTAPSRADRTALRVVPTAGASSVGVTLLGGF